MIFQIIVFMSLCDLYCSQDITGGTFISNKYSNTQVLLVRQNVGPKMCVKNCLWINACVAVNYIRAEHRCELLLGTTPSSGLQDKDGSDYTEMTQWQMMNGPCFPNPCIDLISKTKCVEVDSAEHVCVQVATCPGGWIQFNEKCYYFSDYELDWLSAKSFCESEGWMLAEPRTVGEIDVLRHIATPKQYSFSLGGTTNVNNNVWTWTYSGAPIDIFDWASNQPNNPLYTDLCLEIDSELTYNWNDMECTHQRRFICEKMSESDLIKDEVGASKF